MGPKSKKASAAEKAKDVQETEDPLQAVVLADSFETRFRPFTKHTPRCLLPLANTPLIEYTLEFLANSGVEEVYVYCGANEEHTVQIEAYLEASKWTQPTSPFNLKIVKSGSRTVGDAMRDLDGNENAKLKNDFLIVYGDVVSNIAIEPALREHQARRAKNKDAIMTMILREGETDTHKKSSISPVFVVDPSKQRCMQYEQISSRDAPHSMVLDSDALSLGADEIEVRHDLIDPGIDICTPDVLALWQDNFDYETPRQGFLHSVLKDYELNGKTIHTHISKEGYVERVRNLRSYERISKDILSRRPWPMCPDGTFGDTGTCRMHKDGSKRETNVKVAKSARVGKRSVVGKNTTIGASTRVEGTVIGRDCKIGDNCDIEASYIWDEVEVQDRSRIRNAVIANGVVVGSNSNISEGSLLAQGVHLPPGTATKPRQRLLQAQDTNEANPPLDYDPSSSEDEEETPITLGSPAIPHSTSYDSISTLASSRSSSPAPVHRRTASGTSLNSIPSDDLSRRTSISEPFSSDFHKEASASILDGLHKNDDPSNIQLDLQGLRLSNNASEHAVRKAVVAGLVSYILQQRSSGTNSSIKTILGRNRLLVERQVSNQDDQVDLLLCIQKELVSKKDGETVLLSVCNGLYADDLIEGEGIVQWWEDERGTQGEGMKAVRGHKDMGKLIDIAKEEDDESEEESEEESE